jgi:hypothetical protein
MFTGPRPPQHADKNAGAAPVQQLLGAEILRHLFYLCWQIAEDQFFYV